MKSHALVIGGFSPFTIGHHEVVKSAQEGDHDSVNVFTTHSTKRPISAEEKVKYIKLAAGKGVNVDAAQGPFHAASNIYASGKRGKLVVYGGSDRKHFAKMLEGQNGVKDKPHGYYKFDKIEFRQVGKEREEGAEGVAGVSGSLARKSKNAKELKKYLPTALHPHAEEIFKQLKENFMSSKALFLLGGPGSGKDYVINNILTHFNLVEVQMDQILNGSVSHLIESGTNLMINTPVDMEKIALVRATLGEGYDTSFALVSVTNRVSRERNEMRARPMNESVRIRKWLDAEQSTEVFENVFKFENSLNLSEASQRELTGFQMQIESFLKFMIENGYVFEKKFPPVAKDKETGLPKKYVAGLKPSTAAARKAHWEKTSKMSDSDPKAYEPAPGDATAKTKPSKHTLAVRKMMANEACWTGYKQKGMKKKGDKMVPNCVPVSESDSSLAAKAAKSGISVGTLRRVYKRGVAAWNSGHRPGTTPQQWGHARVNSYINKGKTYHTADKDLREDSEQVDEVKQFRTAYGWAGGRNERTGGTYKHPEQSKPVNPKDLVVSLSDTKPRKPRGSKAVGDMVRRDFPGVFKEATDKESKITPTKDILGKPGFKVTNRRLKQSRSFNNMKDAQAYAQRGGKKNEALEYGTTQTRNAYASMTPGQNVVDTTPTLKTKKMVNKKRTPGEDIDARMAGSAGYSIGLTQTESVSLEEAVQYHLENKIPFAENIFRPGSDMFFELIREAKNLYANGEYTPADEYEQDMLESDLGETAMYEGMEVLLDFPFLEEETKGSVRKQSKYEKDEAEAVELADKNMDVTKKNKLQKEETKLDEEQKPRGKKIGTVNGYHIHIDLDAPKEQRYLAYHNEYNYISHSAPTEAEITKKSNERKESKPAPKRTAHDDWRDAKARERRYGYRMKEETCCDDCDDLNEEEGSSDPTKGKGIGKPWKEGGGGAVYVRSGDGVKKVRFSQSGMAKKYRDPGRLKSFMARHNCLGNKDKTSASYWACRYPRFFSNSGQLWW